MSTAYQIVVCGSIVPDPLQTLEPIGVKDIAFVEHRVNNLIEQLGVHAATSWGCMARSNSSMT